MANHDRATTSRVRIAPLITTTKRRASASPAGSFSKKRTRPLIAMNDDTWPDLASTESAEGSDSEDRNTKDSGHLDGNAATDMDDDEFVDAPEIQPQDDEDEGKVKAEAGLGLTGYSSGEDVGGTDHLAKDLEHIREHCTPTPPGEKEGHDTDGEDLFASTFRNKQAVKVQDDDLEEVAAINKDAGHDQYDQAYREAIGNYSKHETGCKGSRGASTPPPSPIVDKIKRSETATPPKPPAWFAPDPDKDLSKQLKKHQKHHNQAKLLIPRLPLAGHRYWIGVLNIDKQWRTAQKEKDFTWMKGSRLTTVETIWHTYETITATTGFVLLLGQERVQFKDRMEELDNFNDKTVILRAVMDDGRVKARGREISDGMLPQEVVEIVDD